jgi:hypothetical protein
LNLPRRLAAIALVVAAAGCTSSPPEPTQPGGSPVPARWPEDACPLVAIVRKATPFGQQAVQAAAAKDTTTLRALAIDVDALLRPLFNAHPEESWAEGPGEQLGVELGTAALHVDVGVNQLARAYSATPIDDGEARDALNLLDDVPGDLTEIDRLLTTVAPLGVHC